MIDEAQVSFRITNDPLNHYTTAGISLAELDFHQTFYITKQVLCTSKIVPNLLHDEAKRTNVFW